jgi:type I restriction enzyme S subunit
MKFLVKENATLATAGRWDIDYHLPPEGLLRFPKERLVPVSTFATVSKQTRDPTQQPDATFLYVDIASVELETGTITISPELTGEEAPSRARMVIRAHQVIVSTVRPTRGAIAVVPPELDNQICSTGFCVLQCREEVSPDYLHFVLRTEATLEQFRKLSTGSSYPAILEEDVLRVLVPTASLPEQHLMATLMRTAYAKRTVLLQAARQEVDKATGEVLKLLEQHLE